MRWVLPIMMIAHICAKRRSWDGAGETFHRVNPQATKENHVDLLSYLQDKPDIGLDRAGRQR